MVLIGFNMDGWWTNASRGGQKQRCRSWMCQVEWNIHPPHRLVPQCPAGDWNGCQPMCRCLNLEDSPQPLRSFWWGPPPKCRCLDLGDAAQPLDGFWRWSNSSRDLRDILYQRPAARNFELLLEVFFWAEGVLQNYWRFKKPSQQIL